MHLDFDVCYRAACAKDARFDGRFFIAVRSTGIYCRPICPARTPKRENMTFYPSAAAAQEAGYRPCLRCRPETAPDVGAWLGTSNTVSRALALIETGAMDEANVDALAARLGMAERQLRRLFQAHLGASPVAVAQTRRVLLAKQLIHETRLPMAEIAMASGFGSIRRFNETFQRLFARPPSKLRRTKDADVSAKSSGEVALLLRYRAPYDWVAMLACLKENAIAGVEAVVADRYVRTIDIDGEQGTVAIELADRNAVRVTIRFAKLAALPKIIARVRRLFDLAADPQTINAQLAEDPDLASLVAVRPGLRVPGAWDGFELAMRAIAGERIGAIVAACGLPLISSEAALRYAFPSPARVAACDPMRFGLARAKARAIHALAAAFVDDPQILSAQDGIDDAIARLRTIPGLNEATARYIAMKELQEPDAVLGPFDARAERWRPWRAYAAQHLCAAGTLTTLAAE